jgi:ferric-dicitrate binding protein FerR (iron transport regulator)
MREVTGVFRATDPAAFLRFLVQIPGVRIDEAPEGVYIVTGDG